MGAASERGVASKLVERLKACEKRAGVVKVFSEEEARSRGYTGYLAEILGEFYGQELELEAVPDLIIVFEDYSRVVDEYLLAAVELKYVRDRRTARKAYRALGQPLRYLVYGFDAAVFWLVIEGQGPGRALVNTVRECVEWLGLPMVLLATSPPREEGVEVYAPLNLGLQDYCYVLSWLRGLCDHARNPALKMPDYRTERTAFLQRRRALKAALRIP